MPDGCRLSARLFIPEDAEDDPVPAVMVYEPYRDNLSWDARRWLAHFAERGYAGLYLDRRGTGDSEGSFDDEYSETEIADGAAAIEWLARQPWCTGTVGMMGSSWSGFNTLLVAARRPPALRAAIAMFATDDRFDNDIHYTGGCVLATQMLSWAATTLARNARPPNPEVTGDEWRERWLARLETLRPPVEIWLAHQRDGDYWRAGSVSEDYGAIECPTLLLGGWGDPYAPSMLRLLEHLRCPRRAIVGPWGHISPEDGYPPPAIGWPHECLRWWDHWLKGTDRGAMDEPILRYYRGGEWSSVPSWPPEGVASRRLHVSCDRLSEKAGDGSAIEWIAATDAGVEAGDWWGLGHPLLVPPDQRAEDGRWLCFTSTPFEEDVELLGAPEVSLAFAVDRPRALLGLRLCDVAPDGSSTLVTRALVNLTHRASRAEPTPLDPGRRERVARRLNPVSYLVQAGHRLRLAVSQNDWPWAWPSPEAVVLTVFADGESYLDLPLRSAGAERPVPAFERPERAADPVRDSLQDERRRWRTHDVATRSIEVGASTSSRLRDPASGREWSVGGVDRSMLVEGEPLSAATRCERTIAVSEGTWRIRIETGSVMSCDAESFRVTTVLHAYDGDACVFARTWDAAIPRDLV
jgi:putative CocE/NonD family hydrolase